MACGRARAKLRWLPSVIAAASIAVASNAQAEQKSKPRSIWEQETLTGDWGGARTALKDKNGIDITLAYIGETMAVLSGGLHRRASYEGRGELSVDTDLQKLIGWTGGSTHVTVFNIHNGSWFNAADNVGSITDVSNIDARATTRLFTAWYEQSFRERFSVRIGQIAGDGEFFTSDTAGGLINGTFGWANIFGSNMISGGPAYPLATPGVRVQVKASEHINVLAAVFSGDPAGSNCHDVPQKCNPYGLKFSFTGGTLSMGELQYAINTDKKATGLTGVYKLGGWYATTRFPSMRYGIDKTSAVVSLGVDDTADPIQLRTDWGLYGVADQMIWRGAESSVNLFARGGFSPTQRNFISYYVDGGIGFKGPISGRPDDMLTFGVAYVKISPEVTGVDQDALAFNGPPYAIRRSETVYELSYIAQIAPWWMIQPDLQYIVQPNGGQNADDPTLTVKNAFVVGIRSTIKF
jgi:porin